MIDTQMQLVDPADCSATDGGDPAMRPDIEFLEESLDQDGQKVPVMLAPDPERPGRFLYIDGHGRGYCLGRLGRKMLAIVLDRPVSKVERIELKFAHNGIRREMSLEEIAADATEYIELTGRSQKEASVRLKCSEATISRSLSSIRRIPPELRAEAYRLGHYFVSLISPLPDAAAMRQAIAYAGTTRADGRKPTREQVKQVVAKLRGRKDARPSRLALKMGGLSVNVTAKQADKLSIENIAAVFGRVGKEAKNLKDYGKTDVAELVEVLKAP